MRLVLALAALLALAACAEAPKPRTVLDRACDVCRRLEPWCDHPPAELAPSASASATTSAR